MDNARQCRSMALLCRQQASLHPQDNWKWLAQAERWEHLAEAPLVLKADVLKADVPKLQPSNAAA